MSINEDFIIENLTSENGASSEDYFDGRSVYKAVAYQDVSIDVIDTWEKKPFYGLVNEDHNPILLKSQEKLQEISDDVFCLDFVALAYNALRTNWINLLRAGRVSDESNFTELIPFKAYEEIKQDYEEYLNINLEEYINYIKDNININFSINNFKFFINSFKEFLKGNNKPFTLSSLILSNSFSQLNSGLAIEIFELDYSDDQRKYEEVILDPNFEYFCYLAKDYGFRVDKNIPNRIVADIGSPEMQEYMKKVGISGETDSVLKSNFFKEYYDLAYLVEYPIIRDAMLEAYNELADSEPIVVKKTFDIQDKFGRMCKANKAIRRRSMSKDVFNFGYGDKYFIQIYAEIKNAEIPDKKEKMKLTELKKKLITFTKGRKKELDIERALGYTNRAFKKCLAFNYDPNRILTHRQLRLLEEEYEDFFEEERENE